MSRGNSGAESAAIAIEGARRARSGKRRESDPMGAAFNVFPLILIPVIIYNLNALVVSNLESAAVVRERLLEKVFAVPMASNVQWIVTWGDLLLLISLILLFIELLKSTSTGASAIFNHALSMLVFIVCLVEFLLHPAFATTVFFLIMVMSLLDVLAGVIVTIVSARRDVDFERQ
jgi:hypothetical protein